MGCYRDFPKRLLSEHRSEFPTTLRPSLCIDTCLAKGFRYAGTESRTQCFCSNKRPPMKYLTDEASCNMLCSGNGKNDTDICGGAWTLSVHDIQVCQATNEMSSQYLGCYLDTNDSRLLPHAPLVSNLMTPEYCVGYCYRRGFRYAGVEYGKECFCGNSLDEAKRTVENDCSMGCRGELSLKCGDLWRINVYKTGMKARQPIDKKYYIGCFKDSNTSRVLGDVMWENSQTNTPEECMSLCSDGGFKYSGTESGNQCFCGNKKPSAEKLKADKCRNPCLGDNLKFCGGTLAISVYATDKKPPPKKKSTEEEE